MLIGFGSSGSYFKPVAISTNKQTIDKADCTLEPLFSNPEWPACLFDLVKAQLVLLIKIDETKIDFELV